MPTQFNQLLRKKKQLNVTLSYSFPQSKRAPQVHITLYHYKYHFFIPSCTNQTNKTLKPKSPFLLTFLIQQLPISLRLQPSCFDRNIKPKIKPIFRLDGSSEFFRRRKHSCEYFGASKAECNLQFRNNNF